MKEINMSIVYFYKTKQKNLEVTSKYVSIIRMALTNLGYECVEVDTITHCNKRSQYGIVTIDVIHALDAIKKGYKPVICWIQGILPEESYMRNESNLRKYILSSIEKRALKSIDFTIYVSRKMQEHYKEKYGVYSDRAYIMPCFSMEASEVELQSEIIEKNIFLYSGRLDVWQCFEKTIYLYKEIEDRYGDTKFLVMTHQKEDAERIIQNSGIKHYEVDYATGLEYQEKIKQCKFGFCIRGNNVVNHVATPTKFSDYIGNGIIPIYSKNTVDFYERAKDNPYCICMDDDSWKNKLDCLHEQEIDIPDLKFHFMKTFGNYYSSEYHVNELMKCFQRAGL